MKFSSGTGVCTGNAVKVGVASKRVRLGILRSYKSKFPSVCMPVSTLQECERRSCGLYNSCFTARVARDNILLC